MRMTFMKKVILSIVGWVFIFLGIIGLLLPILPGIVFLILGLYILSYCYQWSKHLLETFRRRFPKIARKTDKLIKKLRI